MQHIHQKGNQTVNCLPNLGQSATNYQLRDLGPLSICQLIKTSNNRQHHVQTAQIRAQCHKAATAERIKRGRGRDGAAE